MTTFRVPMTALLLAIVLGSVMLSVMGSVWGASADIRASGYVPEGLNRVVKAVPVTAKGAETRGAIVIKRGDTPEKLVKTYLNHLPFRENILMQALQARNPGAFKGPKSRTLVVGAVITLPTADDYATVIFGPEDRPQALSEPVEPADPRRGWVRYP